MVELNLAKMFFPHKDRKKKLYMQLCLEYFKQLSYHLCMKIKPDSSFTEQPLER